MTSQVDESAVLTPQASEFLTELHRRFEPRRQELLAARQERARRLREGELPDFLEETREIREGDWRVEPVPTELQDRRVEITGPVDRKMVINALNSGARMFMADFEDANSPTWANCVSGQQNLTDALERTITLEQGEKRYRLDDEVATLLVRPRGWHLVERHFEVDGAPISGEPVRLRALLLPQPRARRRPSSTCPSSSRTSRRGSGTTSSSGRRSGSASSAARSRRRS